MMRSQWTLPKVELLLVPAGVIYHGFLMRLFSQWFEKPMAGIICLSIPTKDDDR